MGQNCGIGPGYSMVQHTVRNTLGILSGAVQELQRCLAPLLERGNLLDITMLDMAEKDAVTPPIPTERPHHQRDTRTPGGGANHHTFPRQTGSFRA